MFANLYFYLKPVTFYIKTVCVLLFTLACFTGMKAQGIADTSKAKKRYLVSGFPVIFYTPETRFGYGLTGIFIFNFKKDSLAAPKSSVNLGFAYTQNKQVLFTLPFNLFIKQRNYHVYGELAYNKFFYNFYSVPCRRADITSI